MSTQIRKIVSASQLKENVNLSSSLFELANNEGERYFDFDNVYTVKPEHTHEGIYEINMPTVPQSVQTLYGNMEYTMETIANVMSFKVPSLEDFVNRRTGDGRKLIKALEQAYKRMSKIVEEFGPVFENSNNPYYSMDFQEQITSGMVEKYHSYQKARNACSWLDNELPKYKELEQRNELKTQSKTVYARLSFRSQDVIGMTALGRFSSCQDVVSRGFDEYASRAVASMASDGIGTLTLHETLESATGRDTAYNFSDYTNNYGKAYARVNILQDVFGMLASNEAYYGNSTSAEQKQVEFLLKGLGVLVEAHELDEVPLKEVGSYDGETTYMYDGEMTFTASFEMVDVETIHDELLDVIAQNDDLTDDEFNELDEMEVSELLDEIEAKDLTSEAFGALVAHVDFEDHDTWERWITLYGYNDRERDFQDSEIMEEIDTYHLHNGFMEKIYNEYSLEELVNAMENGGKIEEGIHVEFEITAEDDEGEPVAPYIEGELDDTVSIQWA